jgi:hypothetical protein
VPIKPQIQDIPTKTTSFVDWARIDRYSECAKNMVKLRVTSIVELHPCLNILRKQFSRCRNMGIENTHIVFPVFTQVCSAEKRTGKDVITAFVVSPTLSPGIANCLPGPDTSYMIQTMPFICTASIGLKMLK